MQCYYLYLCIYREKYFVKYNDFCDHQCSENGPHTLTVIWMDIKFFEVCNFSTLDQLKESVGLRRS